jgi:hypothetical protein
MNQGTLNKRMLESAAKEYRRAHQFWRDEFGGSWSHGDASMPNVIYDEKTRRTRLIDFEIMHERSLPLRRDTPMICWSSYSTWWTEFLPGSGFL